MDTPTKMYTLIRIQFTSYEYLKWAFKKYLFGFRKHLIIRIPLHFLNNDKSVIFVVHRIVHAVLYVLIRAFIFFSVFFLAHDGNIITM